MIQRRLIVMMTMEIINIPLRPATFARIPPMAGPIRNAVPNAAPISPIFLVFSSELDISEI